MINAKLQSIIDTKSAIGNAIVNKGGTVTSATPFFNYASEINNISTGTPQTVFQDSTGAKWARTNAVNLTNVSNNVTSDFNWWQPANNTTSDAILNVGTVGANISGNIRLVPVNQVNIAQYVNIVINDTTGAKYVGYNGIDANTNPTPTGNTTFNRWLLNNSATGTIIFANATIVNGGTFNGPNSSLNIASMPFVGNTPLYGGDVYELTTNNGFIYATGYAGIKKYNENNLAFVANSVSIGGIEGAVTTNNGFIYVGGFLSNGPVVEKYHESNLVYSAKTARLGGSFIAAITTNDGFLYAAGDPENRGVRKYHESNLILVSNTGNYGGLIYALATNNGFIYAGGQGNQTVKKFYESNLAFVGNTNNYGGLVSSIVLNNGFLYVAGLATNRVQKYHESNLVFVGNTPLYGGGIWTMDISDGFIYVGGQTNFTVQKFYESNLAFVGNTNSYGGQINQLKTNNGFIYVGGFSSNSNSPVQKFEQQALSLETLTFYTATKIKEDI
jgi:hypothetical protein